MVATSLEAIFTPSHASLRVRKQVMESEMKGFYKNRKWIAAVAALVMVMGLVLPRAAVQAADPNDPTVPTYATVDPTSTPPVIEWK